MAMATAVLAPTTPAAPTSNNLNTLLMVAMLGAGGYAAYKLWYLPYKFRQQLALQAQQAGLSQQDYLARIGAAACVGYGAASGIPPQISGAVCNELGNVASKVLRNLPAVVDGAGAYAGGTLTAAGGAATSIAHGAAGLSVGLGRLALSLPGPMLVKWAGGEVVEGAKAVGSGVAAGAKAVAHVASKVLPWNW
jgi:hypothetical protein